jgi:hypothetical protein
VQDRKAAARVRLDPLAQIQRVAIEDDNWLALGDAALHLCWRYQAVSRHPVDFRFDCWLLLVVDKSSAAGGTRALLTRVSDGPHITAHGYQDDGV